jgi:hypothetical protein
MELNSKLSSSHVLFYSILYVNKEQLEKFMDFSIESQLKYKNQKDLQATFDSLKICETQRTSFPPGCSKMSE